MAQRNPSRPLPVVKNQFRPVSDWLGYITDVDCCPFNPSHVMKSHRLMKHIIKCEERLPVSLTEGKSNVEMEKCPYNSLHRFPIGKHNEHFKECKSRAAEIIARIDAGESFESINEIDNRYMYQSVAKRDNS